MWWVFMSMCTPRRHRGRHACWVRDPVTVIHRFHAHVPSRLLHRCAGTGHGGGLSAQAMLAQKEVSEIDVRLLALQTFLDAARVQPKAPL